MPKTQHTTQKKVTLNKAVKKVTPPKKTTTRKSSVSKTAAPQVEGKFLVCALDDKCFWTTDGQVLKNLEELKLAFGTMGDEVFMHHVTREKNDFADWVEQVLEDAECAAALRRAKKPTTAEAVIVRCLREYKF